MVIQLGTSVTWPKAVFSKILFKKKTWSQLSRKFAGKLFQENYIQIPQANWSEVVVTWAPFERQKVEVHIFDRANLSGFATWEFTTKENFNPFIDNVVKWPNIL